MSTRRVLLGAYGNGIMGLKTALPGYDSHVDDDDDVNKFSFNSQWTDIARIMQVSVGVVVNPAITFAVPDQGFRAMAEFRRWNGSETFYDDYCIPSAYTPIEGVDGQENMSGMEARWAVPGVGPSTSGISVYPRSTLRDPLDANWWVAMVLYNQPSGL